MSLIQIINAVFLSLCFWHFEHKNHFSAFLFFQMRVAYFNFNFLSHYCINFQNLCANHQEEILRFQNTPKNQLSGEYWPRKQKKTKWHPILNKTLIFGNSLFSLDFHNLASNLSNSTIWGCFGIVKISS